MGVERRRWATMLVFPLVMVVVGLLPTSCGGIDDFDDADQTTSTAASDPVPSAPSHVTDPAIDETVAGATAEAVEGQITHDVPAEMVEGETYAIVVRVGSQETAEQFEAAVEASGARLGESERENIEPLPRVAPEMQVILAAPPSFEVTEENSRLQSLGEDGVARWGFQIQPTESGEHEVRITAEIVVGDSVETLEPVYDGTISVAVASGGFFDEIGSRLNPLVGFLVVLASLASGVGGVIVVREHMARSRKRQAHSQDGEAQAPQSGPADGESE